MPPSPQAATLRRLPLPGVWGIAIAVALLAFGLALSAAWIDRRETREHELEELAHFTRSGAAQVAAYVVTTVRTLDLIKFAAEHDGPAFSIQRLIDEKRISTEGLMQLSFINAQGIVRQSTLGVATPPTSVADRYHFKTLAEGKSDFAVSPPVLGRRSGVWSVHVARRVDAPDGSFAGAVVATVDMAEFGGIDGRIATLPEANTSIVGADGMFRARIGATPADLMLIGSFDTWMPNLRAADSGLAFGDNPFAPGRVAVAWHSVKPFDLFVVMMLPETALRADSDNRAFYYLGAAAFVALLAFAAALGIDRHERALKRAADAASRAQEEMARLLAGFGQDLREPIDALRWATDALAMPGCGEAQRQRALGTLRASGAKLGRALNDVLDWVTLTQTNDATSLAALDPRDWAKLTYEAVRGRARDLDVACDLGLDVPDGLRIIADAGRLHRMTNALLVHALAAAGQGGRVGFSVGVRGLDAAHVELAIAVSANGTVPGAAQSHLGGEVAQGFARSLGGTIERREAPGGTLDVFRGGFQRAA
ncbi:MAG: hypothetical protein C6Y20_20365 [Tagaea sp. CACIAM 22H2]|nr:hypothetical protein [Tagaea sp. CACIAM 22H2]